jgi:uncharacterized membrane-anchored protein
MPEAVIRWVDVNVLGWLKARERKVLLVTVAAQLVILVGMIALRAIPLVTGQTVLVRVQPVDPRDLFRGDYVILSYDFSRVPREGIEGLSEAERGSWKKLEGRAVFVPLVPDSNGVHWRAAKVTVVKPATGLFLKGQMERYGSLKFGIEAYYVQEGTGLVYEQAIRDRKLSAELAVTSGGQAALKNLRIEPNGR